MTKHEDKRHGESQHGSKPAAPKVVLVHDRPEHSLPVPKSSGSGETPKPVPKAEPKPTAEELALALKGMVDEAISSGGRDRASVVHAQEILARCEKIA